MRFGSVCSGIEAASVAWHPLGWQTAWVSEVDRFPSTVLAHRFPDVPNRGDMTKFEDWPDEPIDLLVGGTPCQSFSVAGLRKGLADPRGNLMLTFGAIAARYRPRWLVWENVPGVLSSNGGRDFGTFLGMLAELGYGFAYRVLDAQFFGVAQRRRRVFVVGYLGDWRPAAAVLFERESLSGHPAPSREAREGVAASAAQGLALRGRDGGATAELTGEVATALRASQGGGDKPHALICADIAPTLNAAFADKQGLEDQHINGGGACSLPPVAMCLNAGAMGRQDAETETLIPTRGGVFDVAHALRGEGFDASEDGTGRGTPLVPVAYRTTGNDGCYETGDVIHALTTATDPNGHVVAFTAKDHGGDAMNDLSPTLRAGGHAGSHANAGVMPAVATPWAVRRLTPRECERLQGFEDDWTRIPYRNKPADECPDGPRYKALGNSMAVPVMHWIGERIEMIETLTKEIHQ